MANQPKPQAAPGGIFGLFSKVAQDLRARDWDALGQDFIDFVNLVRGAPGGGTGGVPQAAFAISAHVGGGTVDCDALAAQIEQAVQQHQSAPGGAQAALFGGGGLLSVFGPLLLQAIQAWLSRQ